MEGGDCKHLPGSGLRLFNSTVRTAWFYVAPNVTKELKNGEMLSIRKAAFAFYLKVHHTLSRLEILKKVSKNTYQS
jgi:hypothetical protein